MKEEDLATLIIQLDASGVGAMSKIYALTAPHLFGIIHRILRDDDRSSDALRRVYVWLWESRSDLARRPADALDRLRSEAHRYAVEALDRPRNPQDSLESDPLKALYLDTAWKSSTDSERDEQLLQLMRSKRGGRAQ